MTLKTFFSYFVLIKGGPIFSYLSIPLGISLSDSETDFRCSQFVYVESDLYVCIYL